MFGRGITKYIPTPFAHLILRVFSGFLPLCNCYFPPRRRDAFDEGALSQEKQDQRREADEDGRGHEELPFGAADFGLEGGQTLNPPKAHHDALFRSFPVKLFNADLTPYTM